MRNLRLKNKSKLTSPLENCVYIGRGSKWGNPFVVGKDGNREEVIGKYREYFNNNKYLQDSIEELRDKNLVCYCYPKQCHGDILLDKLYYSDIPDFLT